MTKRNPVSTWHPAERATRYWLEELIRGDPMGSFWWVLAAFIGGGCAGVLVMALMCFAGGLPEQTDVRGGAVPRST
jgi:hypothetical protein